MKNPNGPYPGRQLFLGLTPDSLPCMAYLVTGRSPESRERRATSDVNSFYMGPLSNAPYDALRHYTAVKYDNVTGVLAVTNGIQTDAVYEIYRLLVNVGSFRSLDFLEKVLDGAEAEPDSYRTPRIAGVVVPAENKPGMKSIIGIKSAGRPARAYEVKAAPGRLTGISTYKGDLDKPEANQPDTMPPDMECSACTAENLAKFIYDISAVEYKGQDIRVCCIGGIYSENGKWEFFAYNAH